MALSLFFLTFSFFLITDSDTLEKLYGGIGINRQRESLADEVNVKEERRERNRIMYKWQDMKNQMNN